MLRYGATFAVMLTLMLPVILEYAHAVSVTGLNPGAGKPGQLVNILGDGFKSCASLTVIFGAAPTIPIIRSDKLIQSEVPVLPSGDYGVMVSCGSDSYAAGVFTVK